MPKGRDERMFQDRWAAARTNWNAAIGYCGQRMPVSVLVESLDGLLNLGQAQQALLGGRGYHPTVRSAGRDGRLLREMRKDGGKLLALAVRCGRGTP